MATTNSVEPLPVLEVKNLHAHFFTRHGVIRAVNGASFTIGAGETLGLVGESGSGKTLTCLSILRLLPPGCRIVEGEILFEGRDILKLADREMADLRGKRIGLVVQSSMSALDPVFPIGDQIAEPLVFHRRLRWAEALRTTVELLGLVKIPAPQARMRSYPHELSGGMRQRVASAASIGPRPSVLIADEPTTALDVTTQRQYLMLLKELQARSGMSLLLVTHDITLVGNACDRIAVFYGGLVVESGPRALLDAPAHPYTQALLQAVPVLGERSKHLRTIPGEPAHAGALPFGCPFHPRCESAMDICRADPPPPSFNLGNGVTTRCWLYDKRSSTP